jgi:hypothetical protein
MKITNCLLFLFLSNLFLAQNESKRFFLGNILTDTTTLSREQYGSPLNPILTSSNNIEIRFIKSSGRNHTSYIVLSYMNKWEVKEYDYDYKTKSTTSTDLTNKVNADSLFDKLVSFNIFSLPDQDSLVLEKFEYDLESNELMGQGIGFGCGGTCYYIEYKVGSYFRRYSFCNLEAYVEFCPHVHELKDFNGIVTVFNGMK